MISKQNFNNLYGKNYSYITPIRKLKRGGSKSMEYNMNYKNHARIDTFNKIKHIVLSSWKDYKYIIRGQELNNYREDIFYHCYGREEAINYFVLDFDSEDDPSLALCDLDYVQDNLEEHGFNCVVVMSGNKGYHLYTQIPTTRFDNYGVNSHTMFTLFWKQLIEYGKYNLETLDENHWRNSLGANIRLIGSIHPRTGNEVSICDGKFINPEEIEENSWYQKCIRNALSLSVQAMIDEKRARRNTKKRNREFYNKHGVDLEQVDLRDVFSTIYGEYFSKSFGKYDSYKCMFHDDQSPSMLVWKDYYMCKSCGKKGNIRTLINNGYVKIGDLNG